MSKSELINKIDFMDQVGNRIGDTSDLPAQVKSQLKDGIELQITNVIDELYDGVASIDEIIVGIYRKYGTKKTRPQMTTIMSNLIVKKAVYSVKKHVFASECFYEKHK